MVEEDKGPEDMVYVNYNTSDGRGIQVSYLRS
jgi:hypothetical protein